MNSPEIKVGPVPVMTELTIVPAGHGGFVVWDENRYRHSDRTFAPVRSPEFAGTLGQCLNFIEARLTPPEPVNEGLTEAQLKDIQQAIRRAPGEQFPRF